MTLGFLDKYKAMLSVLAVVAIGGVLLTATFDPKAVEGDSSEGASSQSADRPSQNSAQTDTNGDPEWKATSFDDMLGDQGDDDTGNNGFAAPRRSELGDDFSNDAGGFAEPAKRNAPSPFGTAPAPSLSSETNQRPVRQVIVNGRGGKHKPIPVDASRVSAAAGGRGGDSSGETN